MAIDEPVADGLDAQKRFLPSQLTEGIETSDDPMVGYAMELMLSRSRGGLSGIFLCFNEGLLTSPWAPLVTSAQPCDNRGQL